MQLVVVNVAFFVALAKAEHPDDVVKAYFIGVFSEVVALALVVTRSIFPPVRQE